MIGTSVMKELIPWSWTPLKLDSHLPNKILQFFNLLQWKSFKNDEKYFLFHLKSSFPDQVIWIFVLTFWSCRKKGLIGKVRLISKFFTHIIIHILPNISRSKGNQTLKFGQKVYNKRNNFLWKSCRKWGRETSFRPRFVF